MSRSAPHHLVLVNTYRGQRFLTRQRVVPDRCHQRRDNCSERAPRRPGVEGDEVMCFGKKTAVAAAAVLLSAAVTAGASPVTVLKATVPFAFEVNGHSLPAGTYLIQR